MSAMVLSSVKGFIDISQKLEGIGIRNIHFFNLQDNDELTTPMMALVPFMDMLVLGKDARLSSYSNKVIEEAVARHIPVVSEDCMGDMEGCLC
ncbi:MAG: hypothetical protein C4560_06475 [Nitrospiraceae bacterium]|nr:MAG: hypothetical protein C4560_06475 [Nitrospiraceae bacterium]